MQQLKGRSPAEYTGMCAIGLVVVAAWVYSITLEYSFFAAVTPGTNPMFPYLGLAFTGIGLALWGIGFACAHKAFTQVMSMIMMLASGGTAVYIAWVQFQAQGDARYNLALDLANYAKALTIVGIMLLLNVAMLVLKVIVWRFSQLGTSFFARPQYLPVQQPHYQIAEERTQPHDEQTLEQRAIRSLPPARLQGNGFLARLKKAAAAYGEPTGIPYVDKVSTLVQSVTQANSPADDDGKELSMKEWNDLYHASGDNVAMSLADFIKQTRNATKK